jgi:hypothetical protein
MTEGRCCGIFIVVSGYVSTIRILSLSLATIRPPFLSLLSFYIAFFVDEETVNSGYQMPPGLSSTLHIAVLADVKQEKGHPSKA